jgi:nucleoside-diphosphate-sugar epimerase
MSAAPRVFVTGVSGYLGGHTVIRIMEQHPEWNVVVLVRSEEQKNIVLSRWPKIEVIIGDLDNKQLLIKEGSKADVVLRT